MNAKNIYIILFLISPRKVGWSEKEGKIAEFGMASGVTIHLL